MNDDPMHRRDEVSLKASYAAAQVLQALMRCSGTDAGGPAVQPEDVAVSPAGPDPDEELSRAGLGALERVIASCPGVPRSLPPAARPAAPEF